jgi:TolB protein
LNINGKTDLGSLMAVAVIALLGCVPARSSAQERPLGLFERAVDVGDPKIAGATTYDASKQEYTLAGAGANMRADRDEFHFLYKRLKGDFVVQARARFLTVGGDPHKKFGWIVRSDLELNSPHVNVSIHGEGLTCLLFRRAAGAKTEEIKSTLTAPDVFQLERKGNTYTMSIARFGERFAIERVTEIDLGEEPYVGLFVCAHNPNDIHKVAFDNVRITVPAADNFVPYRDYIGSDLEILDVASGHREIMYHTSDSLQAPNWTGQGKSLLYNRNGRLCWFDLAEKKPTLIDTGFATHNNNDHALSPDGKWIGISHHSRDDGNSSIVYVVPVDGGEPRRITAQGPSYLHSWSPDSKWLLYTGERNGAFDIYRISIDGGAETRLTDGRGLNDGAEYSPDGKFIYFNSTRSGTMQLWRMLADGNRYEQVTNDEFNNWFPHLSPDGKQIAFLSFSKDVNPQDHPFYKHVYLRLMPTAGGEAKVIAYVYGGQGTINVSSWSPDSKRLAFVSNTAGD